MLTALLIIGGLVLIALIIFIVWNIRTYHFKPTANKQLQQNVLNQDLEPAGFAYERRGDYFYTLMDCWQREAGYCQLYDKGSPLFSMVMDCEPVAFYYAGKRWLIELWKGQYGITTGGEIGIYCTDLPDLNTSTVVGTFFKSVSDPERIPMSFILRKNGKVLLKRKALHWWLAAFRLGEFSEPDELVMDAKLKFPNRNMCAAFRESLQNLGYRNSEYRVFRSTVHIHYTKPHSPLPYDQDSVQISVVQQFNKNNCGLLNAATKQYPDTLDRLEYLKTAMPELYQLFFHSLYAKGFFSAFDIIRQALKEQRESGEDGVRPTPPPVRPECPDCPECHIELNCPCRECCAPEKPPCH